jgi:hypothetical protein
MKNPSSPKLTSKQNLDASANAKAATSDQKRKALRLDGKSKKENVTQIVTI